jgi:hypothetical protein
MCSRACSPGLTTAQYFALRLGGCAASEISQLAAQSHIWDLFHHQPSSLMRKRGWDSLLPQQAGAVLGRVSEAVARRYVLDGHHKVAAYDTAGWKAPISARVFRGTLREAQRLSLGSNSRDKVPMAKADKLNAAWRLVAQEDPMDSIKTIAETANISTSTVDNMRTALRTLKAKGVAADDIRAITSWSMATLRAHGHEDYREPDIGWKLKPRLKTPSWRGGSRRTRQ